MALKSTFNKGIIQEQLNTVLKAIDNAVIQVLIRLGNLCLGEARTNGNYIDQTGNLRSSVGFIVQDDGDVVYELFGTANMDESGRGVQTGREYALEIAKEYQEGYVMIMVAGMEYAAAVESKGSNVLTSAEMYAKEKLPGMIQQLHKNIRKL